MPFKLSVQMPGKDKPRSKQFDTRAEMEKEVTAIKNHPDCKGAIIERMMMGDGIWVPTPTPKETVK